MSNFNERITIEDHKNDFVYKKSNTGLNIQFNRVAFIFFVFFVIYSIFTIHLIHLGSREAKIENISNTLPLSSDLYRADIIDINGNYLAKTVKSIDVGLKTSDIISKEKLLLSLKIIFPEKDFKEIEKKIENKKFFYLEKKILEEKYEQIMKLGDKSLIPEEKVLRMYPQKNLFSHILGQIDNDNNGISGLEKSLNENLRSSRDPIKLTVDKDIQFLIRKELLKYQEIFKSKGSAAILMDVNNGNILSLVSLPDFNPNERKNISDVNYINRVTKGTYELGSVFKVFTFASALNEKLIERAFEESDLEGRDIVICATDNYELHQQIVALNKETKILTNVADTPELCDFYLGSIVSRGDLKIAISTNGKSPTLGKRIRQYLEDALPNNTQSIINGLKSFRDTLKGDFASKVTALNEVTKKLSDRED